MPPSNKLTDIKIKNSKANGKIQRLSDGEGLYLEISVVGGKSFRMKYRFDGKEKRLTFGPWPDVSLREAREKRDEAKKLLREGIDPSDAKKSARIKRNIPTFYTVAHELLDKKRKEKRSEGTIGSALQRLELDVFPAIGTKPITDVSVADIIGIIRGIEAREAYQVSGRVLNLIGQTFRLGIATGVVDRDMTYGVRDALVKGQKGHFASITNPTEVGRLVLAIRAYQGVSAVVKNALIFSMLTFQRPGNIRSAEWAEIDFERALWTIPEGKMKVKGRGNHIVPLSIQAVGLLKELYSITGQGRFLFPTPKNKNSYLSENAVRTALRSMGYSNEQMCPHGFRHMASTLLNEKRHESDFIECQLAHLSEDKVRNVYNQAEYVCYRVKLMQDYADLLDELADEASSGTSDKLL